MKDKKELNFPIPHSGAILSEGELLLFIEIF